jgi:hypothetical protein
MIKSIPCSILLTSIFIACSHETETQPGIENECVPLLVKEIYSDDLYWEYTYNEANLLREMKTRFCYSSYVYNDENQLISYDCYEDSRIYSSVWVVAESALHRTDWVTPQNTPLSAKGFYTYDHGKLQKIAVHRGQCLSISGFTYDNCGRITRQTFLNGDDPTGYFEYEYDDAGNVVLKKNFSISGGETILATTVAYEYDDKSNPFKAFSRLLLPGIYTNENNVVRETLTLYFDAPGVDSVQVTESTYEYNEHGYPVKKDNMIRYEYR